MKHKTQKIRLGVPKGADEKSLDKKVKRWADRKVYGIAWSVRNGVVEAEFWMHTGLLKEDPKEFDRAVKQLNRIVERSAPQPPKPTPAPKQPRQWHKRLRGPARDAEPGNL